MLATPGLTAIRDPALARAVLLDDALRGVGARRGDRGAVVDVGSGGGTPGIPLAVALPEPRRDAARGGAAQVPRSSRPGRRSSRTSRVVWGRAEEQEPEQFGVAVAKALARPPTAAEWCLPLVREGGLVVLWVGESAEPERVAAVAERIAGSARAVPAGLARDPQDGPDAAGFPAPHRRREEAAAGLRAGAALSRGVRRRG